MKYSTFDNSKISNATSMYEEIHNKIVKALKSSPLDIYDLCTKINKGEDQYVVSGQLQFLKKKGIVESKKIKGIHYWGIPKENRTIKRESFK